MVAAWDSLRAKSEILRQQSSDMQLIWVFYLTGVVLLSMYLVSKSITCVCVAVGVAIVLLALFASLLFRPRKQQVDATCNYQLLVL